MITKEVDCF